MVHKLKLFIKRSLKRFYRIFFPVNRSLIRKGKKSDFVFIHIDKTGGTSLSHVLGLLPFKSHFTVRQVQNLIGLDWHNVFTFSIVRNPYDRVVSQFEFRKKRDDFHIKTNNISFDDWVKSTYKLNDPKYIYDVENGNRLNFTQKQWLTNDQGVVDVDYILKFENITNDYKVLQDIIGLKKSLPHMNKTERKPYKYYYSDESKSIVENYFKEDFEEFNYNFD